MTVFQDTDHFGSLWWQSFKTAITSAVFDGTETPLLKLYKFTNLEDLYRVYKLRTTRL